MNAENMHDERESTCGACNMNVVEPFITCAECPHNVSICLRCFSKGEEFGNHRSYHSYEVMRTDFSVLEAGWTAAEDLRLLTALLDCGHGNWQDVANQVRTKTAVQCERHYHTCFITSPTPPLPELPEPKLTVHPAPVPMRFCEDPPRPSDGSSMQQDMSGYMAARGDFITEYNNFAETDVSDVEFKDTDMEFDHDLKLAVMDVYHNVLQDRHRRKKLIRDHGLVNIKKQAVQSYTGSIQYRLSDRLRVFMQVAKPQDWDMYLQALNYEYELKASIQQLQVHRACGITRLHSARVYDRLYKRRVEEQRHRQGYASALALAQNDAACEEWLQRHSVLDRISKGLHVHVPSTVRKSAPPLQIVGLPSFEKLCEAERKLCSTVRLVPDSYLEFKRILMTECNKQGYLRLAQARTLIKIDVNKTRKLFDFLIKQNLINKEPLTSSASST